MSNLGRAVRGRRLGPKSNNDMTSLSFEHKTGRNVETNARGRELALFIIPRIHRNFLKLPLPLSNSSQEDPLQDQQYQAIKCRP